jgi:SAM-dependent methyltransferase
MLPLPRPGRRSELRDFVLDVNHLIGGRVERLLPWDLLVGRLAPATLAELRDLSTVAFFPLWSAAEAAELSRRDRADVGSEWRRRLRAGAWAAGERAIVDGLDVSQAWGEIQVGDFDAGGRGRDYTEGMQYFQAARAFGVETLLALLGAFQEGDGWILDVLGGDGYILRIFEAVRRLRAPFLWIAECRGEGLRAGLGEETAEETAAACRALLEQCPGALILALEADSAATPGAGGRVGRWLSVLPSRTTLSEPFELSADEMEAVARRAVEVPAKAGALESMGPACDLAALVRSVSSLAGRWRGRESGPRIITNDISPHMFFSAGRWGLPTREDARRLSRTFREGSLDAVLFAYGTHHVTGLDEAIRESFRVLRPGGCIVLQDFLDEGPVGRWFHQVVDPYSRTGHDFAHIGLVQLAVELFLAGFREVRLFEMEDPFLFAVPEGTKASAREVARTYLLGMYGLGESRLREPGRLESCIEQILSYEEIGNRPLFDEDFVYIPRRATVATAVRPHASSPLSLADRVLAEAVTELLTLDPSALRERGAPAELLDAWYRQDGTRWGLGPDEVSAWFRWAGAQKT